MPFCQIRRCTKWDCRVTLKWVTATFQDIWNDDSMMSSHCWSWDSVIAHAAEVAVGMWAIHHRQDWSSGHEKTCSNTDLQTAACARPKAQHWPAAVHRCSHVTDRWQWWRWQSDWPQQQQATQIIKLHLMIISSLWKNLEFNINNALRPYFCKCWRQEQEKCQ